MATRPATPHPYAMRETAAVKRSQMAWITSLYFVDKPT
jgi:hypothetical protein